MNNHYERLLSFLKDNDVWFGTIKDLADELGIVTNLVELKQHLLNANTNDIYIGVDEDFKVSIIPRHIVNKIEDTLKSEYGNSYRSSIGVLSRNFEDWVEFNEFVKIIKCNPFEEDYAINFPDGEDDIKFCHLVNINPISPLPLDIEITIYGITQETLDKIEIKVGANCTISLTDLKVGLHDILTDIMKMHRFTISASGDSDTMIIKSDDECIVTIMDICKYG